MKNLALPLIAASCFALLANTPLAAATPPTTDTAAQTAIVIDYDTGAVLYDKGADERIQPASLSKMMTAYVVYSNLKSGRLKLDDTLPVSQKAWEKHKTNESNMFVPLGAQVKVEDLIRGMMIQSGNDACVVLAEGIAGSTDAFVDQMNQMAQKLGLKDSHFADVDGLPDPEEYMTARDIALLGIHLIRDFPEYYHYDAEKEFTYNGIKQGNRNPLLYKDDSVDGLKTGHTDEAGYGVAISAIRNGRRLVEALVGMKSMNQRSSEAEKMLDWAYREWADYKLVKAGDTVDQAPVWMGVDTTVPVTVASDVLVSMPRNARSGLKVSVAYNHAVPAPVKEGEPVGTLKATAPEMTEVDVPLIASKEVDRMTGFGRAAYTAGYLVFGRRN